MARPGVLRRVLQKFFRWRRRARRPNAFHLPGDGRATYGALSPTHHRHDSERSRLSLRSARRRHQPLWRDPEEITRGLLFGIINAVMCLPVTISFATIIFRHEAFAPYLPTLVRLVLFSSTVHALCFSALSSMPFAVGQVQDAGLIFLSAMASTIADCTRQLGLSDSVMLSTTLVMLALSTAVLGLALIAVGKLKLASLVQYLPMSVIGGYLAFIGFYCGQAGMSFMTQLNISHLPDWGQLGHADPLLKLAPGVGLGLFMLAMTRVTRHVLTLPTIMVASVIIFYGVLNATGMSLQTARDDGWVAQRTPPVPFYRTWELIDFTSVRWQVIPLIIPQWLALFFVVAFSSSLDVAAIETEVKRPLNYNRELQIVGLSNAISGITGGFTGSYIFSQTIFTLRAGVHTRLCTLVIAILEAGAFIAPVSLIAFIPRFFFGGLLSVIAIDLMLEWLWHARKKMMTTEFVVSLLTFVAIQATNIELGMAIGVLAAILSFVVELAKSTAVLKPRVRHSSVVRTFEERRILNANMDKLITVSLRGYIFFGSAVKILQDIKEHVLKLHTPAPGHHQHHRKATTDRSLAAALSQLRHAGPSRSSARPTTTPQSVPRSVDGNGGTGPVGSHRSRIANVQKSSQSGSLQRGAFDVMTPVIQRGRHMRSDTEYDTFMDALGSSSDEESGARRRPIGGAADAASTTSSRRRIRSHDNDSFVTAEDPEADSIGPYGPYDMDMDDEEIDEENELRSDANGLDGKEGEDGDGDVDDDAGDEEFDHEDLAREDRSRRGRSPERADLPDGAGGSGGLVDTFLHEWAFGEPPAQDDWAHHASMDHGRQANRTRYLIFDFEEVIGLDATAARSCFLMLKSMLRAAGIRLIFAAMSPKVRHLLTAHNVVSDEDRAFDTLDEALEHCEELLLRDADELSEEDLRGLSRHPSYYQAVRKSRHLARRALLDPTGSSRDRRAAVDPGLDLDAILADYMEYPASTQTRIDSARLARFFEGIEVYSGQVLFRGGEASDALYFIRVGVVELQVPAASGHHHQGRLTPHRLMKVSDGGSFGELGFFLRQPQIFTAVAITRCRLYRLSRQGLAHMAQRDPSLCCLLQLCVLKSMSLTASFRLISSNWFVSSEDWKHTTYDPAIYQALPVPAPSEP